MRNLIENKHEFEYFTQNVMPPLKDGEHYFVSLSARNKYLDEEERQYYQLGRTEMFARTVVYNGDWDFYMKKMSSNLDYRRTKSGLEYPTKALVVYVNINPSNVVLAAQRFAQTVSNITGEMTNAYMNGREPNLRQLDRAERLLMNEVQKATGTRHYVDIDLDTKEQSYYERMVDYLDNELKMLYYIVETKGGYHFLVRQPLPKKNRLFKIVAELNDELKQNGKECIFNSNAMVPMPGTLQGGHLVRVVNKG